MPYYIRLLSPSDRLIAASALAGAVPTATLSVEAGSDDQWEAVLLAHPGGREVALVARNPVSEGSMASEEIEEFVEELDELLPASGAEWLRGYLPQVRVIYAFQILGGADDANGWDLIGAVKNKLWNELGGIFQADGEGFSNEDGYHVVWQFSDHVSGPWWMGVRSDGKWVHFRMELGDKAQREAFFRGEVPAGAPLR